MTGVRLTLHEGGRGRAVDWAQVGDLDRSSYSLVLGAGGATGAAFEAGVLLALATDFHVSLAAARSVIGTSAGSIGASLIALGFDGIDVAAVVAQVYEHVSPSVAPYAIRFDTTAPPLPRPWTALRTPSLPWAASTTVRILRRHFTAAVLSTVRDGAIDVSDQLQFLAGIEWAELRAPISVCAVDGKSGARRTFDGACGVSLLDAVAASCSVPGVMRPVRIDGKRYVDGTVASPTNADIASGTAPLVIIASPMSGTRSRTLSGRLSSIHARRRLDAEVARLRDQHTVLVIEPADQLSVQVVDGALDGAASPEILANTYFALTEPASVTV